MYVYHSQRGRTVRTCLSIVFAICAVAAHCQQPSGAILAGEDIVRNQRRVATYGQICKEASRIRELHQGNSSIVRTTGLLLNHAELVMPYIDGSLLSLVKAEKKPSLFLLIVQPEDRPLVSFKVGKYDASAYYDFKSKCVYTRNDNEFSIPWLTYLTLHEVFHWDNVRMLPSDADMANQERLAYLFEAPYLYKDGGKLFEAAVKREMARLRAAAANKGVGHRWFLVIGKGDLFVIAGAYDSTLDQISAFGPAKCDEERNMRQYHVWVHAAFRLINQKYSGAAERVKYQNHLLHQVGNLVR